MSSFNNSRAQDFKKHSVPSHKGRTEYNLARSRAVRRELIHDKRFSHFTHEHVEVASFDALIHELPEHFEKVDNSDELRVVNQLVTLSTKPHHEIVALYPAVDIVIARLANSTIPDSLTTQYCLFLGNIAADCSECRKVLLSKGVFEAILHLLSETHLNVAAWIICNLTRETEGKERWNQLPDGDFIRIFSFFLTIQTFSEEVGWMIAYLTASDNASLCTKVLSIGIVPFIASMLTTENTTLLTSSYLIPLLRIIGNISKELPEITTWHSDSRQCLLQCLTHSMHTIQMDAIWVFEQLFLHRKDFHFTSFDIQLWSLLAQLLHTDHQEVLFQWMLFLEICSIHTPYLEQLFTECIPITSFITCILSILSNTHITHPEMLYALLEVLTAIFHTTNESMKYAMCNLDLLEAIDNLQYTTSSKEISRLAETFVNDIYAYMESEHMVF